MYWGYEEKAKDGDNKEAFGDFTPCDIKGA